MPGIEHAIPAAQLLRLDPFDRRAALEEACQHVWLRRYYAALDGDRYRVSLPEGEYALGFFPRNLYASPLPSYRVRVVESGGEGRLETIRLPMPGASAVKAVKRALGRILPEASKRTLQRILVRP